jgi:hypothetical protein
MKAATALPLSGYKMTLKLKKLVLTRFKTLDLLKKIATTPDNIKLTLYFPPHLNPQELKDTLKEIPAPFEITTKLSQIITSSPNGAVVFWGENQKYLVIPPFLVIKKNIFHSLEIAKLLSLLEQDYCIGIIMVRLGSYAIGFCRGDKLVSSKVGTGLIHGRHRQGGSSAHRFERHRDKQIESFLLRVCGHVRERLEPQIKSLDYIVYGGARTTILMLQKYCPLLGNLDKPTLPPLLNIPEPRQVVLESAVSRIWSSTIYSWTED